MLRGMRRVVALLFVLAAPVFAADRYPEHGGRYVVDTAGIIDADSEARLRDLLKLINSD